jgi:hypothetical protein
VRSVYLAGGAPGYGEAAAGDHLQTGYRLWLVGDQLGRGAAPWRDPYSFQPEAEPQWNPAGWPFGLPYWPLSALFGPVLAWNLFTLLAYVGAGALTYLWLRSLDVERGAALVGGLAFALAPYRVQQSVGHLLGPISMLIPLTLWGIERRRWWLAAAALASIPLSGQVHLALGAIPLAAGYALIRRRDRRALLGAAAAVGTAVVAGLLVQRAVIADSIDAGGRSLAEVARYSAEWADFLSRDERHGSESFVFVGWLTPLVAIAGLVALATARRIGLAVLLAVAAALPALLALGTNLPLYSTLWRHVEPFRFPRVPERLMPIACLAIATLVAFALGRFRAPLLVALAVVVIAVDLDVRAYGRSAADTSNSAYAAIREGPPGRLLELPVFTPDLHYGSVYMAYDMQVRRERPGGYSTLAPLVADVTARRLAPLNCGEAPKADLAALGVRYVAVHEGVYRAARLQEACASAAAARLERLGFTKLAAAGPVTVFKR